MDDDEWAKILLLVLLLVGAAYCAATEIAFSSLNTIRVKNLADKGDKRAHKALYVTENIDKAITTLLIGNNITHIGFASLVTLIVTQNWGTPYVKYGTVISTLIVFLFSEMLPKSYAKSNLDYALTVSGSLSFFMKLFSPFSRFFTYLTDAITKLLKVSENQEMKEEDFLEIMKAVEEEEVLDDYKQQLIHSALDFDSKKVGDIYVPMANVYAIEAGTSPKAIVAYLKECKFSRLPVYKGSKENIIGILHTKKYLKAYIRKDFSDTSSFMQKPTFIKTDVLIDDLLRKMSREKTHICIVRNDAGKSVGIVTLEDILEQLVGDIWDETDLVDTEAS